MHTLHKQISPPKPYYESKISLVSQKWIPKAVELKRIPKHKKCKWKKKLVHKRGFGGEIYSSDVAMYKGVFFNTREFSFGLEINEF